MSDWRDEAACKGVNPSLFFGEGSGNQQHLEAKRVCSECPVRVDCLEWALANLGGEHDIGVWGGTSPRERAALRRGQGLRVVRSTAVCGTEGGYSVHRRSGEDACRACQEAHNAAARASKARRREREAS